MSVTFEPGDRVRLPGKSGWATVDGAMPTAGGWKLYLRDDDGNIKPTELQAGELDLIEFLSEDGSAASANVLAGLWAEWMRYASQTTGATAMATTPLVPYPHQNRAVYGAMLPQPLLRFLLADEPGTGKTIMAGLWLREAQRLGFVERAVVVCPAHLVSKWQEDWARFFGGELRRIEAETVRQSGLEANHDMWVVSLDLAGMNGKVRDAIHPDRMGWDAVVFDEAHRLTPSAQNWHQVGKMLARTPRALFMTATPHRGNEWLFRSLMHLVDPNVFPEPEDVNADQPDHQLKPGPLHFIRRMKEELVDLDGKTKLFNSRTAYNHKVPMTATERTFYEDALELVEEYFPLQARTLAQMVYGKRAASSLQSLAETLRRRMEGMGSADPSDVASTFDPEGEDPSEADLMRVVHEQSKATKAETKAAGTLRDRVLATLADPDFVPSKWPRLVDDCLAANGITPGNGEQAVIFTEFTDTADWLADQLNQHGFSAKVYSGRKLHSERDATRAEFASRKFQILVSTDAGNEGIDLQSAHVLVNWDIPWSLVRLEQRMGRIHRVGQTRPVHLYNLVALNTREGDAHYRLLENLVTAANELDGRMFDSLALLDDYYKDVTGKDTESVLASAFDGNTKVVDAAKAITADKLRVQHEVSRAAADALATEFGTGEVAKAVAAVQQESLERINPHIVERFLTRLADAGLVGVKRAAVAEEGMWMLSPTTLPLPEELTTTNPNGALVATSGKAKRDAVNSGVAAAQRAVSLGPSEPPFRGLARSASGFLRPSLFQGGTLNDPTSVTDYTLVAFEVPVEEGGGRRHTHWSYLVRVDETGARVVNWELLANLHASDDAQPRSLHPAHAADAEGEAKSKKAKDHRERKGLLAGWLREAGRQLQRLPQEQTRDIADHNLRTALRDRLKAAADERLKELAKASHISAGEPSRLGWAHVVGTAVPPDPTEKDSEAIAMKHVTSLLRKDSWAVADRSNERPGPGYDLHATRGNRQRCVEVKGVWMSASSEGIRMTGNEVAKAGILGDDFWLYVVDQCQHGGDLYAAYQDPADVFAEAARDVAIVSIPGSALSTAKKAQNA